MIDSLCVKNITFAHNALLDYNSKKGILQIILVPCFLKDLLKRIGGKNLLNIDNIFSCYTILKVTN